MNARVFRIPLLIAALSITAAIHLQAAPSLPITEPPVASSWPDGPIVDPGSINGQWFLDMDDTEEFRTHEFYDNVTDHGGDDPCAIDGRVTSLTTNAVGYITAFSIKATIENNTPWCYGQESDSSNRHDELRLAGTKRYIGILLDTKLTVEFAIAEPTLLPRSFTGPYQNPWPPSFIIADNEDQLAWYCWNERAPPQGDEPGNYYVPTWDFGDIAVNERTIKTLNFTIAPPMDSADPRYAIIQTAFERKMDLFANRTTSLKISTWIDGLGIDTGRPYPDEVLRSSDVSVFHNVEEPVEPSHKMHWPQLPDPFGWDVRACLGADKLRKVLADDFLCTSNGPITHITFWGSFQNDEIQPELEFHGITLFHLSLHSDIPAGEVAKYSMPQVPALWEIDLDPYAPPPGWTITVKPEIPSPQGWYDPNTREWNHPDHENYYRYDVFIPQREAFVQTAGTIYWLDISVETTTPMWGWKTSRSEHFNDDAVWADLPVVEPTDWNELIDPVTQESLDLAFIIDGEEPPDEFDWGDAPDRPYPTRATSNGAYHLIAGGISGALRLGDLIDAEPDGQPDANATGDDLTNLDDEDGITFITPTLYPGAIANVIVKTSFGGSGAIGTAYLQGWVDFNGDGDWNDSGEQVYTDKLLNVPANYSIPFPVPTNAVSPAMTFARFRISTTRGLTPTGFAPDGEVEDYEVSIGEAVPIDWGDVPNALYRTLGANNGPHHLAVGPYLGILRDAEPDGQPSAAADGDDNHGVDDEDGVTFTSLLQPGGYAQIEVVASAAGKLDAWIDFDGGGWHFSSDRIFSGQSLSAGTNALSFAVPLAATNASPGSTYARFRLTTGGVASYVGLALDGEVEDYLVKIEELDIGNLDWGDAPDRPYPTLMPAGASHIIVPGIMLGATIDGEPNGQPSAAADGDDIDLLYPSMGDDEDGVAFTSQIVAGTNASVDVVAGVLGGTLDAWIDFNADGDWNDSGEQIFTTQGVAAGLNSLSFPVPQPSAIGSTYARFRISSGGTPLPGGASPDGEIEDYTVELYQPAPMPDIQITNLFFTVSNTVATVEWNSQNFITYQMQATTNLMVSNSWVDIEAPVLGPVNWQTNGMATQTNMFYRITAPWTE